MSADIPFGTGVLLIFMAMLYSADAHEIFVASAMAAASCSRSVAGAILPFADAPMSTHLLFLEPGDVCYPFSLSVEGGSDSCAEQVMHLSKREEGERLGSSGTTSRKLIISLRSDQRVAGSWRESMSI